jgi:hypothetical protein
VRLMTFSLLLVLVPMSALAQQPAPGGPPGDFPRQGPFRVFPQERQPPRILPRRLPAADSNLCYKLRVYQMARKPHSDETYPVGQRTCTPATAFRLKPSVANAPEDSGCPRE